MCWSVLCKNWIVVFKVKVRVKFQNFTESVSVLYFLYHRPLFQQTRCVDVLLVLLITKPSTTNWVCTENNTVILSITRHTAGVGVEGGGFALQYDKLCFMRTRNLHERNRDEWLDWGVWGGGRGGREIQPRLPPPVTRVYTPLTVLRLVLFSPLVAKPLKEVYKCLAVCLPVVGQISLNNPDQ